MNPFKKKLGREAKHIKHYDSKIASALRSYAKITKKFEAVKKDLDKIEDKRLLSNDKKAAYTKALKHYVKKKNHLVDAVDDELDTMIDAVKDVHKLVHKKPDVSTHLVNYVDYLLYVMDDIENNFSVIKEKALNYKSYDSFNGLSTALQNNHKYEVEALKNICSATAPSKVGEIEQFKKAVIHAYKEKNIKALIPLIGMPLLYWGGAHAGEMDILATTGQDVFTKTNSGWMAIFTVIGAIISVIYVLNRDLDGLYNFETSRAVEEIEADLEHLND